VSTFVFMQQFLQPINCHEGAMVLFLDYQL